MKRRTILTSLAVMFAGPQTSLSELQPQRTEAHTNELQEYRSSAQVLPLPEEKIGSQFVARKAPIRHTFTWTTVADEKPEELETLLDITQHDFKISGKPVQNPDQYWSNIYSKPDDQWGVEWSYVTPGKSPGEHTFSSTIEFERPFQTKSGSGGVKKWSGTYEFTGVYRVI